MKKAVFLPYDFDTAIGINNEGALAFSYNLEDIDTLQSGADVFNGQQSVLWKNLRAAFFDEIKAMYQSLRSSGALSYSRVEQMFEEHQDKWPEAIFNEDAFFKYLQPLIDDGSGAYLSMLQGSKAEQRKWWLYNRFKYIDSKYNAGDALTDVIQLRGYAKANMTITPYADIYPAVKFGSYLVSARGARGTATTLVCPLDNVNDTEIYVYSASQLASIGDISGLKVGFADLSMATKLQSLKIGDGNSNYSNGNLTELTLGNNTLLQTIDVRNCPNLTQAIDLSGCINVENVYFGGTAITSCNLPNGGVLKVLQLPSTITNLTIRNQPSLATFSMPSYENISTLRIENAGSAVNALAILKQIAANSRVRIVGLQLTVTSADDVEDFYDLLDTMRGLDENGNNVNTAQVQGVITGLSSVNGSWLAEMTARYPDISIHYEQITYQLKYYSYDGSTLIHTEDVLSGGNGTYSGQPSRAATPAYTYTFAGWSRSMNQSVTEYGALTNVTANRNVYAVYTATPRTYNVYFYNGSTLLQTVNNVAYGGSANYTGTTPTYTGSNPQDYEFTGWSPSPSNIQGDTSCYAQFRYTALVESISDSWADIITSVNNGTYASKYSVGDTKLLDLGSEGVVLMQIAAFNADDKASGGKAAISWISEQLLQTSHRMNPALAYNTKTVAGWTASSNTWTSQNRYTVSTAKATWVITATEAGTLSIGYKTSNASASANKITILKVNGTDVVTNYANTTGGTYNVEVSANDTVEVYVEYDQLTASYDYYGTITFSSTGAFSVSSTIQDTTTRDTNSMVVGTGAIGGWESSEMRSYLKNTIKPLIPAAVRNAIVEVTKVQPTRTTTGGSATQQSTEDVWIPSYNEIFGVSSLYYPLFQNTNANREKKKAGASSATHWWLRSAYNSGNFYYVSSGGSTNGYGAHGSYGVALGFCM